MNVLVITASGDQEGVNPVLDAITRQGGIPIRFDTDRFPTEIMLEMALDNNSSNLDIITSQGRFNHATIKSIYYRRYAYGAKIPLHLEAQSRAACVNESKACCEGMLGSIDAFVLDPYWDVKRAENKQLQLKVAKSFGIEIPKTLVTNNPQAVKEFASSCENGIITKMQKGFSIYKGNQESTLFTSKVSEKDLDHLEGLRLTPMTFQEQLLKKLEYRVTIVGDKIFSSAVDSSSLEGAALDWRKKGMELLSLWKPVDLPTELENRLFKLMDYFNLQYGAIDIIQTLDNRYVFLEINPVGEYFWLDNQRDVLISDTIAEVLLGKRKR